MMSNKPHSGLHRCPNCRRIVRHLPVKPLKYDESKGYNDRWYYGEADAHIVVEPYEFYTWFDFNFPMKHEIRIVLDDGHGSVSGGMPLNRNLYCELVDDPNVDYKALSQGYIEHEDCESHPEVAEANRLEAIRLTSLALTGTATVATA